MATTYNTSLNKLSSGSTLRFRAQRLVPCRPATPLLKSVRKPSNLGRSLRGLSVRADDGFDLNKALQTYKSISYKIPPVVSAATIPVVGVSLLCKLLFGTGLPGSLLGGIEGISYLVLVLGAGSLGPRLSSIIAGGDYTLDAMLEVLQKESDGMDGKDATSRFYNASVSSKSALNAQMEDLKKRKAEKASETPEETAAREAVRAKLAAIAIENATKNQEKYSEDKGADKKLLKKSATETISECMTTENFDKNISEFRDEDLNDKLNLSKTAIESGAPVVEGKGDDWRGKNLSEAEARTKKSQN